MTIIFRSWLFKKGPPNKMKTFQGETVK